MHTYHVGERVRTTKFPVGTGEIEDISWAPLLYSVSLDITVRQQYDKPMLYGASAIESLESLESPESLENT